MNAVKITKDQVEYVAHLARLEFGEQEKEKFTTQLNNILLYMEKLNEVDTTGVEPETHAIAIQNAFREDVVRESLPPELSLANAPAESGNSYRVPKVLNKGPGIGYRDQGRKGEYVESSMGLNELTIHELQDKIKKRKSRPPRS